MRPDTNETPRLPVLDQLRDEFLRVARTETTSPKRRRLRLLAIGAVAVTFGVAGAVAGVVLTGGSDQNTDTNQATTPPPPPRGIETSGPTFGSLDELVANSDLILVGTVQEVRLGPVHEDLEPTDPAFRLREGEVVDDPPGGDEYPTRDLNTVVAVEDVLKGSSPTATVTVATLENAYGGGVNPTDWRQPGVRVVAFLSRDPEGRPLYIASYLDEATAESKEIAPGPNYDQSFYVVDGEDLVAAVQDPSLPLNAQIEAMSLTELSQAVKKAATANSN